MEVIFLRDGCIALLAAVGLTTILWGLAELIFRRRETRPEAIFLLPVKGEPGHMEFDVQQLLGEQRRLGIPVVLMDCGLTEESRCRAELLTRRYEGAALITCEELVNYWKQGQTP